MACEYMTTYCRLTGSGVGWLTWIWTRTVPAEGSPTRWLKTDYSCHVPADAAAAGHPALTRAVIERAFRRIGFSHPGVHIQPEGNTTLVNLPTFYQVRWARAGHQPGEIATVHLLGTTLRIRPSARFTYDFGDGESTGPTSDPGGTYPQGRIQHTYAADGTARVHVIAHYTGQYSIGAGWQPIDVTVPVSGTPVSLRVRQAHAHLTADDG